MRHNLIILSDVHLGSDLVQHQRPGAPPRGDASMARDRDLSRLFDWYRTHRRDGQPWRLVIAGDLVDFVGMSVSASDSELQLNEEESLHGLGASVEHTLFKLRRVAEYHTEVFRGLAEFVASGNQLVVVRGNHDVDFHWQPVQDEFVSLLSQHVPLDTAAISFCPWFYYEEGRVYIEHGHQYDPYCSHDHVLHPLSPLDPQKSSRSLSDILLRFVVRPTHGLTESGHDHASLLDYLRFAGRLGVGGMAGLGQRFFRAVGHAISVWWQQSGKVALIIRREHERKVGEFAERSRMSLLKLRELLSLQHPPVTRSLWQLLSCVMLDRVLMGLSLLFGLSLVALFASNWSQVLSISGALACSTILLGVLWYKMRSAIDSSSQLRERAARIAQVFPAAFIVMGHTHVPERSAGVSSTYVNLGAWAEQDLDGVFAERQPPSRTHLVVHESGGLDTAELMVWDSSAGPQRYLTQPPKPVV